jgi:8-oxo-dGTP pyrophosphatase MutT (NUDIX family)
MNSQPHDTSDPLSEPGFRARAADGLLAQPSPAIFDPRSGRALGPSDWDLSPEFLGDLAVMGAPRPAAVLVPIVLRPQLTVMLTQRSHDMPSHPGQISFPGGKLEECDASPVECALREAQEEIGLARDFVEPLGYLDSYRTGTGFQISPVVALVRPGFHTVLDAREVLEVFEVPLDFLMDKANHQKHSREWRGRQRFFYAMPYEGRYIWGATAGMLKNLHDRLFAPSAGRSASD